MSRHLGKNSSKQVSFDIGRISNRSKVPTSSGWCLYVASMFFGYVVILVVNRSFKIMILFNYWRFLNKNTTFGPTLHSTPPRIRFNYVRCSLRYLRCSLCRGRQPCTIWARCELSWRSTHSPKSQESSHNWTNLNKNVNYEALFVKIRRSSILRGFESEYSHQSHAVTSLLKFWCFRVSRDTA